MPGCHITWPLLAGIGKVESAHASGGKVDANGNTRGKILGPVLDGGPGMAAIADTDQGVYDGEHDMGPRGRADAVHPGHLERVRRRWQR